MSDLSQRICIIGGGPAGLACGMYLEKKGYENYVIYEKLNKVGGKAWSPKMKVTHDGKTYYVRGRYAYYTIATGTTVQYTDYSPVRQFVYKELLVGDVNGDGEVNIADVNAVIDIILN